MPTRPPTHRPNPAGDRARAAAARARSQAQAHIYTRRWDRYSRDRLKRHPWCVECQKQGQTTQARVTDHVRPHGGDYGLMWSESNHQSLCLSCHSRKTVREDGGFGRAPTPRG